MRSPWILACLGCLLAFATSVKSQEVSGSSTNPDVNVTVYLSPTAFTTLSDQVNRLGSSITAFSSANAEPLNLIATRIQQGNNEQQLRHADLIQQFSQAGAFYSSASTSLGQIATMFQTISPAYQEMVPALNNLRASVNAWNTKADEYKTSVQVLTASVGTLGTTVAASITAANAIAANQFTTSVLPPLNAIKNILLTNGIGNTNAIFINSTNGDITMTNFLNLSIPGMERTEELSEKTLGFIDSVLAARELLTGVPSFAALEGEANSSGVIPWVTSLAPTVHAPGLPADFMRISVAKPMGGGSWVFDANPMTHFPEVVTAFRTGLVWVLTLAFLSACAKLASDFLAAQGSMNQIKGPNLQVAGTNAGVIPTVAYIVIYGSIAAMYAVTVGGLFNFSGTWMSDAFNVFSSSPLDGMPAGVYHLSNMFFPLQLIVAMAAWLASSRYSLLGTHWVALYVLRRLPA